MVHALGANPHVFAMTITNEVNVAFFGFTYAYRFGPASDAAFFARMRTLGREPLPPRAGEERRRRPRRGRDRIVDGLLRADYSSKPAFGTFRALIGRFGAGT
ncbi:MAG: hypothetical protein M3Z27_02535 [Actinomycetota bacterium]|nr:hypothetical protein [Actinomycetota bacterium]